MRSNDSKRYNNVDIPPKRGIGGNNSQIKSSNGSFSIRVFLIKNPIKKFIQNLN